MPTAPTLVAFAEVDAPANTGVNITSASLSWETGDVITVFPMTPGATDGEVINAPTTTGSGVSFGAAQQQHNSTGTDCGIGCWSAVATQNSSGTFSFNYTRVGATNRNIGMIVAISRGSGGIGNSVIYLGATPNGASLTPGSTNSMILWAIADWAAAATVALSPTSTSHNSTTPGPQAAPYSEQLSPDATYYGAVLDDQTSGSAASYGIASGTGPFSIIAIEIEAQAGTPADSGPNPAGAAADLGGGSGSWTNPTNAQGTANTTYAVWTAP